MDAILNFAESFPAWLQWAAVMLVSAIPFVESYFGSAVGVIAGVHPALAVAAAVVGNTACMLAVVWFADRTRRTVRTMRSGDDEPAPPSAKRARFMRLFNRWGVPGVSLLGQTFLPSQITSGMMVGLGASAKSVALWQVVSIALWGSVFAGLAVAGVVLIG